MQSSPHPKQGRLHRHIFGGGGVLAAEAGQPLISLLQGHCCPHPHPPTGRMTLPHPPGLGSSHLPHPLFSFGFHAVAMLGQEKQLNCGWGKQEVSKVAPGAAILGVSAAHSRELQRVVESKQNTMLERGPCLQSLRTQGKVLKHLLGFS